MNDKGLRTKTVQMKKRQLGCRTANVPKGRVLQEERFVQKKVAGLIRLQGANVEFADPAIRCLSANAGLD